MPTPEELEREELEETLAWVIDFREQVERAERPWLPMGFAEIPDTGPLRVIERMLREALG